MTRKLYSFILYGCLMSALAGTGAPAEAESTEEQQEAIAVGSDLQLFVDDFLIDQMSSVQLQLHRPSSAGKALSFDQPWEGDSSTYVSVFKDGDRFRMYYRGSGREAPSALASGEKTVPAHPELIAYAESEDGIRWTRPSVGIYEFQGSKENNIVWMDKEEGHKLAPCMHVFKDTNPAAAASERYKALGSCSYPLVVLASPDGLHWSELRGQQSLISDGLHRNAFDAISSAFWDPIKGHYVVFFRDSDRGRREGSKHKKGHPVNGEVGTWFGAFRIPNLVPRSLVNIVGCSSRGRGNCGKLRATSNWASKPVIRSFPSAVRTVEKQLRALASSPPELVVFPRFA